MAAPVVTLDTGGPAELLRGQTSTLTVTPWLEDGTSPTPGAWTAELWLDEVRLLNTSGTGAVSWALAVPSTYALRDDYQIRWSVTISGVVHQIRQAALICRSVVRPTLVPRDIYLRFPALNPAAESPLVVFGSGQSVMTVAAEAWREVLAGLRNRGQRPHMVVTAEDLQPVHLAITLQRLAEMLAATLDGGPYLELATRYAAEADHKWKTLTINVAPDEQTEGRARRVKAAPLLGGAYDAPVNRYQGEPGMGRFGGLR